MDSLEIAELRNCKGDIVALVMGVLEAQVAAGEPPNASAWAEQQGWQDRRTKNVIDLLGKLVAVM